MSEIQPTTSDNPTARDPHPKLDSLPVGMGRELPHVRRPEDVREPHVVEFDRVTKTYGVGTAKPFTAIRDVSFVVQDVVGRGEFVGILGPSGCGKSTILRLIAGLEPQHPPSQGAVKVMGQSVAGPGAGS